MASVFAQYNRSFSASFLPRSSSSVVHSLQFNSRKSLERKRLHISSHRHCRRLGRTWAMRGDSERDDGEESPESLFMKELRRRGLTQPTKAPTETKTKQQEEEIGGTGQSFKSASSSSSEWAKDNQLKRSQALNSEGLDGLLPRAQELIKLGGTFFLAFWPLIIATIAIFIVIYLYFGPSFIHEGELHTGKPPYVDPYQLLEEETAVHGS